MTVWKKANTRDVEMVGRPTAESVPLKWAHDADSGELRYIHDDAVAAKRCSCVCAACSLPLTPVLPGQPQGTRPSSHFRHPDGTTKDSCVVVSERIAATWRLREIGVIDLPRHEVGANAVGFSGAGYEGWAEAPAETVAISRAHMVDHATALLTLDDGRQLYVDLTGTKEQDGAGGSHAVISVDLSDPALAGMSIEEIRARLKPRRVLHRHAPGRAAARRGTRRAPGAAGHEERRPARHPHAPATEAPGPAEGATTDQRP
jgi:hypothetical protein